MAGRDAGPDWRVERDLCLGRQPCRRADRGLAQHQDREIITSFPGLAEIGGAIVLAEIGDDRTQFVDDRALQAFAGSAQVTPGLRQVPHRDPETHEEQPSRPPSVSCGRSPPPPDPHQRATTTCDAGTAVTPTRPLCGTCSTRCSASSITAWPPASFTTVARRFPTLNWDTPNRWRLDRLGTSEVSSDPWSCGLSRRRSERGPLHRRPEGHVPGATRADLPPAGVSLAWFYKWVQRTDRPRPHTPTRAPWATGWPGTVVPSHLGDRLVGLVDDPDRSLTELRSYLVRFSGIATPYIADASTVLGDPQITWH